MAGRQRAGGQPRPLAGGPEGLRICSGSHSSVVGGQAPRLHLSDAPNLGLHSGVTAWAGPRTRPRLGQIQRHVADLQQHKLQSAAISSRSHGANLGAVQGGTRPLHPPTQPPGSALGSPDVPNILSSAVRPQSWQQRGALSPWEAVHPDRASLWPCSQTSDYPLQGGGNSSPGRGAGRRRRPGPIAGGRGNGSDCGGQGGCCSGAAPLHPGLSSRNGAVNLSYSHTLGLNELQIKCA